MNTAPFFWLIAAVGFLVLEGCTFNMTSIWFAIGAAAALISCLFTDLFRVQALLFITLCRCAGIPARVRLDGVDWNARCVTPGDILNPGDHCRVTEIHSTLLLVEPILTESRKA